MTLIAQTPALSGDEVRQILESSDAGYFTIGKIDQTSRSLPEHFVASAENYQRDLKRIIIDGPGNIKALPIEASENNLLGLLLELNGVKGQAVIYRADSFDPVRTINLNGNTRELFLGFEMSKMVLVFEEPANGQYSITSKQAYILDPSVVTTNRSIGFLLKSSMSCRCKL